MLLTYEQIITATNAELVAAFRQIVAELNMRDTEAIAEARTAWVDEEVKKKNLEQELADGVRQAQDVLHRQKIEAQQENDRMIFAQKKDFAEKISALLRRSDITIRPWAKGSDSRLYVNFDDGRRLLSMCCLYISGNDSKRPGLLEWGKGNSQYQNISAALTKILMDFAVALPNTKLEINSILQ